MMPIVKGDSKFQTTKIWSHLTIGEGLQLKIKTEGIGECALNRAGMEALAIRERPTLIVACLTTTKSKKIMQGVQRTNMQNFIAPLRKIREEAGT